MADALLRYSRIKSFMFQPTSFLSFSTMSYNLRNDEIILLQTLLMGDYFDNLVAVSSNDFIKYNTYDSAIPYTSQAYSNVVDLNRYDTDVDDCSQTIKHGIHGKWGERFPKNSFEFIYNPIPPACSFNMILQIIANDKKQSITLSKLKDILIQAYGKYYDQFRDNIIRILISQGKKQLMNKVLKNLVAFNDVIMSEEYYITNLDIWILSIELKLPIILFSGTILPENNKKTINTIFK